MSQDNTDYINNHIIKNINYGNDLSIENNNPFNPTYPQTKVYKNTLGYLDSVSESERKDAIDLMENTVLSTNENYFEMDALAELRNRLPAETYWEELEFMFKSKYFLFLKKQGIKNELSKLQELGLSDWLNLQLEVDFINLKVSKHSANDRKLILGVYNNVKWQVDNRSKI